MGSTASGFAVLERGAESKSIQLAMQRLFLRGSVCSAGARLLVQHGFTSAEKKPIEVVYACMLPRDAALRRFVIRGEGFTAKSELRPTQEAIKLYERGVEQGSLSTLAREHKDGIVNLTVGNIRPGETVTVTLEILAGVENHDDGYRFRFPFTLAPGYHAEARALEVEPGYGELELPEGKFGDVLLPRFAKDSGALHAVGFYLNADAPDGLKEVASASHAIRVENRDTGARISLARGSDLPNRDLVLDMKPREAKPEVFCGGGQDGKRHFFAIVPSTRFGEAAQGPRRVVLVLDRSGSMAGAPITQAKRAIEACLGALRPEDEFSIIAFDDELDVFGRPMAQATKENRNGAAAFLQSVDARGGTELAKAIQAAGSLSGGGDVLVFTDGQVFGTEAILDVARSTGIRIHTLGIGSASQDRFLASIARDTGGVSRFVTAGERVDLPAVDLFASIGRPVAAGIAVGDAHAPSCVFQGTPLVIHGTSAQPSVTVSWKGGSLELPLSGTRRPPGETLRLLRGARILTELAGRGEEAAAERKRRSIEFGLASREMSLVSVVTRASDVPGVVPETQVVPVGMPEDTPFGSYFPAQAAGMFAAMPVMAAMPPAAAAPKTLARASLARETMMSVKARFTGPASPPPPPNDIPRDILFEMAAAIEDDGGMPGSSMEERVMRSLIALLAFLADGDGSSGPFRAHVERLVEFIEAAQGLPAPVDRIAKRVLERVRKSDPAHGDWKALWQEALTAQSSATLLQRLETV